MSYKWDIVEREIFTKRFGSMSVTEMRKVLFAVYMSNTDQSYPPTDYAIGRNLGLTAAQVKNLKIGANLLLEGDEETESAARANLKAAFERGLVEYQPHKKRIAVQIDDPVAFNFLTSKLVDAGVFRDCDCTNGHIAVPVQEFQTLLKVTFETVDTGAIQTEFVKMHPEFERYTSTTEGNFFAKFSDVLTSASIETATNYLANLATVLSFVFQVVQVAAQ